MDDYIKKMVNSSNYDERVAAARMGQGLEVLVNDSSWYIRVLVAFQGYGLDQLWNDKEEEVRGVVERYLEKRRLTLN